MTAPDSIPGPTQGQSPVQGVSTPGAADKAKGPEQGGEVFRALLESLERRAGELEAKSREELAPEDLAGAVDEARESMRDALALQQDLLEAWRQSQHQAEGDGPDTSAP